MSTFLHWGINVFVFKCFNFRNNSPTARTLKPNDQRWLVTFYRVWICYAYCRLKIKRFKFFNCSIQGHEESAQSSYYSKLNYPLSKKTSSWLRWLFVAIANYNRPNFNLVKNAISEDSQEKELLLHTQLYTELQLNHTIVGSASGAKTNDRWSWYAKETNENAPRSVFEK